MSYGGFMPDTNGSDNRGYYRDATGTKWTVGVAVVVDLIATTWFIFWSEPDGKRPMPLSGLVVMLTSIGVDSPGWLLGFIEWLHRFGPVLFMPVFAAAFIMLLQSTHKHDDLLYRTATVILVLTLFEMNGSLWPALWLWLLLGLSSLIAGVAAAVTERRQRRTVVEAVDYFGSRFPSRVFLNGTLTLLPPFVLVATIISAIREAYTLPERDRLWPEFATRLTHLQEKDPESADALRAELLFHLSSDNEYAFDRRMMAHTLTVPNPRGAIGRSRPSD